MKINLEVRFLNAEGEVLCFKHAVMEVSQGRSIEIEIDDFSGDTDMRKRFCERCYKEDEKGEG